MKTATKKVVLRDFDESDFMLFNGAEGPNDHTAPLTGEIEVNGLEAILVVADNRVEVHLESPEGTSVVWQLYLPFGAGKLLVENLEATVNSNYLETVLGFEKVVF